MLILHNSNAALALWNHLRNEVNRSQNIELKRQRMFDVMVHQIIPIYSLNRAMFIAYWEVYRLMERDLDGVDELAVYLEAFEFSKGFWTEDILHEDTMELPEHWKLPWQSYSLHEKMEYILSEHSV